MYFSYNSQSNKYLIVQRIDKRDKGGNKPGSDEDGLEIYLYGGSVSLRNKLKVRGRLEEIISQLWAKGPLFYEPLMIAVQVSLISTGQ